MQKFYNRQKELQALRSVSSQIAQTKGQLSVMVGRRRVGKTRLLSEAFDGDEFKSLYLFISRKTQSALVSNDLIMHFNRTRKAICFAIAVIPDEKLSDLYRDMGFSELSNGIFIKSLVSSNLQF